MKRKIAFVHRSCHLADRVLEKDINSQPQSQAEVAELVDAHDSNSCSARSAGSIPAFGTWSPDAEKCRGSLFHRHVFPFSTRVNSELLSFANPMNEGFIKYEDPVKQARYDQAYIRMALEWAKLSHCKRKQVGAIIVKEGQIIADGYNGTPTGFDNCCEDDDGSTKWYVLHAEANAIMKVARSMNSARSSTLYLTMSPCKECSKLVHQAGIKRLVFLNGYKDMSGVDFLKEAGVEVVQITLLEQ